MNSWSDNWCEKNKTKQNAMDGIVRLRAEEIYSDIT